MSGGPSRWLTKQFTRFPGHSNVAGHYTEFLQWHCCKSCQIQFNDFYLGFRFV
jgi:hypothetical protein